MESRELRSCLYAGLVRHRRFAPRHHDFSYHLYMVALDLAELDRVFARRWIWSVERRTLVSFRRADHLGPTNRPLDEAVRNLVEERTGERPQGRIVLLTHLRHFGYCFNPVSFYYIYSAGDDFALESIVAEVNNTPWGERHCYVLPARDAAKGAGAHHFRFPKQFHVSPFMPMDVGYEWHFSEPGDHLAIHMENHRADELIFDATMALERRPISGANLAWALVRFPLITLRVIGAIYWQALRLWVKRVPFITHPSALAAPRSR